MAVVAPRGPAGAGERAARGVLLVTGVLGLGLAGCSAPAGDEPGGGPDGASPSAPIASHAGDAQTSSPDPSPDATAPSPSPVAPALPTPTEVPVAPPAVAEPLFRSSVEPISPALADRMAPSWRPGCPVPLEDLRYVTVSHVDFEGHAVTGELVVHADVADGVVGVFAELFAARYPVRLMRLVDDFGADDTASMDADNTSAFNCRAITGGTGWSEHAYGRAIDLNPVENPYVVGSHVAPEAGREFADRPDEPGVIHDGDIVVEAFARAGWMWGGHWSRPVDYQHFSVSGR